jgi:hypothetical protein
MEGNMSRQNVIFAALGGLALALTPVGYALAQSGDAVANAERTCIDYGVGPNAAGFETCVDRAAMAYDQGEPEMASQQAAMVRDAHDVCRSYGLPPSTMGFRQCVANETRQNMSSADHISYLRTEQPHQAVVVDDYGFQYDRHGNLLDPNGNVIRYVPR